MRTRLFTGAALEGVLANIGLLIARLGLGGIMAFNHGWSKLPPSEQLIAGISAMGFYLPVLCAWLAGISEFFGALLVAIGWMTRLGAGMVMATMAVAAFIWHSEDPFAQKEMAFMYLFGFLVFATVGAGKYSVDGIRGLKRQRH